jgi:hypothetical protein
VCAAPDSTWIAVDRRGHVFRFRCDMVPVALAEGKKSQTLKRGVDIVGFASPAELAERRVHALTAQGWVHTLRLPAARKPPKLTSTPLETLPLAENDRVVALLGCDAPSAGLPSAQQKSPPP